MGEGMENADTIQCVVGNFEYKLYRAFFTLLNRKGGMKKTYMNTIPCTMPN